MNTTHRFRILTIILTAALLLFGCSSQAEVMISNTAVEDPTKPTETGDVVFTLQTVVDHGKLAYIGIGGEIDGVVNPDLVVQPGAVVRLILLNGDGMQHDLFLPTFDVKTSFVSKIGDRAEVSVNAGDTQPGAYAYYCTVPGHRQAGQEGRFIIAAR